MLHGAAKSDLDKLTLSPTQDAHAVAPGKVKLATADARRELTDDLETSGVGLAIPDVCTRPDLT
jgi:hypothetical protein